MSWNMIENSLGVITNKIMKTFLHCIFRNCHFCTGFSLFLSYSVRVGGEYR